MIIDKNEVLAKSVPPVSLKQHVEECLWVLELLKKAFERLFQQNTDNFWKLIRLGVIFHDLGKSHSEFQKMLNKKKGNWYHQRHELFSVPFINQLNIPDDEKLLLRLIVAGHHKDFNFLAEFVQHAYKKEKEAFDFSEAGKLDWEEEFNMLNLDFVKSFLRDYGVLLETDSFPIPFQEIKEYTKKPFNSSNINFKRLLLLAGALKQCDHMASAGIFKINILEENHFKFLYSTKWSSYHHQKKAGESQGNIILTSPTGSGKTEASLMWLHQQIKKTGQGRVFYILPFTASINAMYERLNEKMEGENEIVGLIHGKLSEYIESRFEKEEYSVKNEDLKRELKENYRSLVPPLKVTTPFQLLKYIFGLKGFEKGIFEMSGAYFIFDEIHAYDPEVTAQIKVLIEFAIRFLNVNVCLMTATLPSFLKRELAEAIGSYSEIKADNELYQSFMRHRIKVLGGVLFNHIYKIQERINKGEKVLVVCNTVKQAQHVYNNLTATKKVLLHGAFNGIDRNKKEKDLKSDDVRLLVGTQAIEVSLDIDYDVIFTEPAPLDALLQRFGRVNRHRINGKYRPPCDCIVFSERNDADKYIYRNEEIVLRTLEVLHEIENQNDGVVSEIDLQKYIDKVYPKWNETDLEDFKRIYVHLRADITENLSPFIYDRRKEEEFEKQFDGIKVLPAILEEDYINLLNDNKFIKAESLKVSISRQRFMSLSKKQDIDLNISAYQLLKKKEVKEQYYYVINRQYDSELGLQIDIEYESNSYGIIG